MKTQLVLFSGGVDSSLVLQRSPRGSVALFVHYGQPAAEQERLAAQKIAHQLSIPLVAIQNPMRCGEMHSGIGESGPRVVPARNLMLISLAANLAADYGAEEVAIGCSLTDAFDYADCRPCFLSAMDDALSAYGLALRAPLVGINREQIVEELSPVIVGLTWSCYEPQLGLPCGICNSCRQDHRPAQ